MRSGELQGSCSQGCFVGKSVCVGELVWDNADVQRLEGFNDVSEIQMTEAGILFTTSNADIERFRVNKSVKDLLYLDLIDVAADPRGVACCRVGLEPSRR